MDSKLTFRRKTEVKNVLKPRVRIYLVSNLCVYECA